MAYTEITDHDALALARLAVQFAESTNLRALVTVSANGVQTAEDVFWALYSERLLTGAVGAQLDSLGAVVGQPRESATDDQYRARIAGRILANRSNNGVEVLLAIVRAVLGSTVEATFTAYPPASFVIDVAGAVTADDAEVLAGLIRDARAAGIGASLVTSTSPDAETLAFQDPVGFLAALTGAGASTLVIAGDATVFPASGTLLIDENLGASESKAYTSRTGSTFTLTGTTANAHAAGASVRMTPPVTDGLGFGDSGDPAEGGDFAGVLSA